MKSFPGVTNIMNECPLEHHARSSPWPKEEPVEDFTSCHAQLSVRGRRALDRLLVLLKSQLTSHVSSFPPALLFSVCDALQLGNPESSAEQNDPSVLPSVLSKLRDWRLLPPDFRYSPEGIHNLALDLAAITDEAPASASSDPNRASHARLRVKWVVSDSPRASQDQDRDLSSSPPPSPSPPRSPVLDSAQACAHALPDLNKRRSDAGYEFCQAGRLGTPDPEDASSAVSVQHHYVSGFRNGCSACRHLRLSGPTSNPPSPRGTCILFRDVNRFDTHTNNNVTLSQNSKSSIQHSSPGKSRREKPKASSLQSVARGAHVDENEPPPSQPPAVQQAIGISFPRQRTHFPRISNAVLSREPLSPPAASASVQRHREPNHLVRQTHQGDKRTTSHRLASVDLRLSMIHPRPNHASLNDLHPPTRAQSFSYSNTPDTSRSHGVGSVGDVPKLSSKAVQSRSSKRLPSWTRTHPTTSATPTAPAKADRANTPLLPLGVRSRPLSTSIPPTLPSDVKHRDRRSAPSNTHKHTSSVPILPFSPASTLIHARKRQA